MSDLKDEVLKEVYTKTCRIVLYAGNIVMIEGARDTELTETDLEECQLAVEAEFEGDYGYLLSRINDFSVAFKAYLLMNGNERLKAIAIITYRKSSEINLPLEKSFFTKPVEGFQSLESAKSWLSEVLS